MRTENIECDACGRNYNSQDFGGHIGLSVGNAPGLDTIDEVDLCADCLRFAFPDGRFNGARPFFRRALTAMRQQVPTPVEAKQ